MKSNTCGSAQPYQDLHSLSNGRGNVIGCIIEDVYDNGICGMINNDCCNGVGGI